MYIRPRSPPIPIPPPRDITVYRPSHLVLSREFSSRIVQCCLNVRIHRKFSVADKVNSAKQHCITSDDESIHGSADDGFLLMTGMRTEIAL
jgi:GTP cyclohydrolase II